jgi:hypothetical protein
MYNVIVQKVLLGMEKGAWFGFIRQFEEFGREK